MKTGVVAINIIPDRNYGPKYGPEKYRNLCKIVETARKLDLIPVVGTEMNGPGQKFVDDFGSEELAPMLEFFLTGAHIVYAHEILQRQAGIGYCSEWAKKHFPKRKDRNDFFEELGKNIHPEQEIKLSKFDLKSRPDDILKVKPE